MHSNRDSPNAAGAAGCRRDGRATAKACNGERRPGRVPDAGEGQEIVVRDFPASVETIKPPCRTAIEGELPRSVSIRR